MTRWMGSCRLQGGWIGVKLLWSVRALEGIAPNLKINNTNCYGIISRNKRT